MARERRNNPSEGIHHVTNHIVDEGGDLFHDDYDRLLFLRLMERARRRFAVRLVSYCLMGNHFHLIVMCPEGNLDGFMHHLEGCYAQAYNLRHGRRGALFCGRYHNELITTDGQLQFAVRYVDRNPLELGIDISTYPWASYASYVDHGISSCEIVTLDPTLVRRFAGTMANYRSFVETDFAHDKLRRIDGTKRVLLAGRSSPFKAMGTLCSIAAEITGSSVGEIATSRRGRTNDARQVALYVAATSDLPRDTVRSALGFAAQSSYSSAVTRAEKRFAECDQFRELAHAVRNQWVGDVSTAA